jgi:hypothetical protein
VSAINAYGISSPLLASSSLIPPKQTPQPPTGVTVAVHTGSATSLDVTYTAPVSNGGSPVLSYRVELDTTAMFSSPIHAVFACPTDNSRSVFSITTSASTGDPIISGYFGLTLSRNGSTFTSDAVPYDAAAMKEDEVGLRVLIEGVTATLSNGQAYFTTSIDTSELIFPGDRLQFVSDRFPDESFTVHTVNPTSTPLTVTVNATIFLPIGTGSATALIYRFIGGNPFPNLNHILNRP